MSATAPLVNAMSVDVEDYFQVQAFADLVRPADWDGFECRVEANVERILAQFAAAGALGTFFTLGWVAERYPAMVRRIVAAGHELASHGQWHQPVYSLSPEAFLADVTEARAILEDVGGVAVRGYRAPTFSIGKRTPWAYAMLEAAGYQYSSSVYPRSHDLYGDPDAAVVPHRAAGTSVWEIPMTTVRMARRNLPCSGGGYFRLLPYALFRFLVRRANGTAARPAIFYFHPWEVDPDQPRIAGAGRLARFRHYVNLGATAGRLDRLLSDFAWDRMDRVYADRLAES